MNTMLKPRMNAMELIITLRINLESCPCNSSTPTPEINDTYPGTRGSTQGDKNEIKPAVNEARGSGRLAIVVFILPVRKPFWADNYSPPCKLLMLPWVGPDQKNYFLTCLEGGGGEADVSGELLSVDPVRSL